jgi:hypothetical protein
VTIKKKFVLALIAYAALGVLAWTTLSDEPIRVLDWKMRLRSGTLLILGLFAFRAALYYWRTRIEEERAGAKPADWRRTEDWFGGFDFAIERYGEPM